MGKVLVVTSGKGGVGKTTAVANIGTGLAREGHSVALVDTDIGLRNLQTGAGVDPGQALSKPAAAARGADPG